MTLIEALQQLEPHLKSIEYDAKSQGYWVSNRNHFFSDDIKGDWRSEFVCSEIKEAIASRGWSLTLQQCQGKWSAMILGDGLDAELEEVEFDTEWEALTHEFVSVMAAINQEIGEAA